MIRRYLALLGVLIITAAVTLLLRALPSVIFSTPPIDRVAPPVRKAIATQPTEPADEPAPKRLKDHSIDPHFLEAHDGFVARGKQGNIDLLFLGDSITAGWLTAGADVWNKQFTAYHPANFGLAGDRTQHLLWRIDNGELDGINPKVVVLLIGTNNTDYPAEGIIRADQKIVGEIRGKLPQSKLLLMAIFPREFAGNDPVRLRIKQVNAELEKLDDGRSIRYLDIGDQFLIPTGAVNMELMPDFLHLSEKGYGVWAEAMQPLIREMMGN
jgi:lysophospholipase L1-like esterase